MPPILSPSPDRGSGGRGGRPNSTPGTARAGRTSRLPAARSGAPPRRTHETRIPTMTDHPDTPAAPPQAPAQTEREPGDGNGQNLLDARTNGAPPEIPAAADTPSDTPEAREPP